MPLQYHSNITPLGRIGIVVYTPGYGNSTLHQHSKATLLPLRQGKGSHQIKKVDRNLNCQE